MNGSENTFQEASIHGLVLAGGGSSRMGQDKGLLEYHHGIPQVLWLTRLLEGFCKSVYVSVNSRQHEVDPYVGLPTLLDRTPYQGPAAGLLSAWEEIPGAARLVVAVDLPFVNEETLERLVAGRSPGSLATAFRHPVGILEPVCTLWEPAARVVITEQFVAGEWSLRQVLEAGPVGELTPSTPRVLRSVNTPNEYQKAVTILAAGSPGEGC